MPWKCRCHHLAHPAARHQQCSAGFSLGGGVGVCGGGRGGRGGTHYFFHLQGMMCVFWTCRQAGAAGCADSERTPHVVGFGSLLAGHVT